MNHMSVKFTSYTQAVLENLREKLGDDYTVFSKSIRKNNGIICTGIIAKKAGQNVSPVIYIDNLFRENITEPEIKEISNALYDDFIRAEKEKLIDLSDFSDFERAGERLAFKLISAEKNSELLQKVPHKRFYNLAMVFYYTVPEKVLGVSATILIKNSHMRQWGIRIKELYETAFANTPVLFPGVVDSMETIMRGMLEDECEKEKPGKRGKESTEFDLYDEDWVKDLRTEMENDLYEQKLPMYVLTNRQKMYGAACMLYPGLLRDFAAKIKQDFYILPSSVHEVILVPACVDATGESLKEIVTDINRTQVSDGEVLSDSVYYYSRNRDKILWLL